MPFSFLLAFPPKCWENFDDILNCSDIFLVENKKFEALGKEEHETGKRYLELGISGGKKGRFQLMRLLKSADDFVHAGLKKGRRVLVCCENGHDVSVVVTIGVLAKYFTDGGVFHEKERPAKEITKAVIRQRLHYILRYRHMASPLRSLMRILNSHLMSPDFGAKQGKDQEFEDDTPDNT